MFNYFEDYGYDSCTARGVCSISPRMASINEILLLYLKEFAYYSLKLSEFNINNQEVINLIINSLSAFVSNPELPDNIFAEIICTYTKELGKVKDIYIKACETRGLTPILIESKIDIDKNCNVIHSIRLGEQNFLEKSSSSNSHYVQELLFFTAKSLVVKLLELNSYGENSTDAVLSILNILNFLNKEDFAEEELKNLLLNSAEEEYSLIKKIAKQKASKYGTAQNVEVSLSTTPNKAILVDGTNINELGLILEATKDFPIDVYTHGELLSAHTLPKIREYSNLKGHYGHGCGNSILDFSTFPGAIFVGKHSINNIENLYKGRLFTSDIVVPSGVIKIENDDFKPLIESALNSRGFKRGKKEEPISVFADTIKLQEKLLSLNYDDYEAICLILPNNDSYETKNYFDKLLKLIPKDILVINFGIKYENNNIININSAYDLNTLFEVINILKTQINTEEKPIIAFVPRCDNHIINLILNLQLLGLKKVFMGKCPAKNLNPVVVKEFCRLFNVSAFSSVKEDYKIIIDLLSI